MQKDTTDLTNQLQPFNIVHAHSTSFYKQLESQCNNSSFNSKYNKVNKQMNIRSCN